LAVVVKLVFFPASMDGIVFAPVQALLREKTNGGT
jgi:hypothetical protein